MFEYDTMKRPLVMVQQLWLIWDLESVVSVCCASEILQVADWQFTRVTQQYFITGCIHMCSLFIYLTAMFFKWNVLGV